MIMSIWFSFTTWCILVVGYIGLIVNMHWDTDQLNQGLWLEWRLMHMYISLCLFSSPHVLYAYCFILGRVWKVVYKFSIIEPLIRNIDGTHLFFLFLNIIAPWSILNNIMPNVWNAHELRRIYIYTCIYRAHDMLWSFCMCFKMYFV